MNMSPNGYAILALFVTSLLVRVLPTFLNLPLTEKTKKFIEQVLPIAVFLNFIVYLVWSETQGANAPAIVGILTAVLLSFLTRISLVITTLLSVLAYVFMANI